MLPPAGALAAAKPRNVFLTQRADNAEPGPVKVIDFGLAKILDGQGSSRGSDGLLIGTPEYLAPEAWRGISSEIDARSDQWSLAVLTYRMLAGRLPFEMSSDTVMLARAILSATPCPLRQVVPDLPVHVEAAVAQALAKDKERRFPSVLDFIRALHGLPPAGTIKLRRDPATALLDYRDQPATALLDYRDQPTAALVDYRERPTAAMVEHDESRTVACHRLRDSTAMLMPAALSAGAESTALLGAPAALAQRQVPASAPVLLAESVPTLPGSGRVPRTLPWRWVTPALLLLAALALRSLPWTRPGPPAQAAAAPIRAFEHPVELAPPPVPLTPPAVQLAPPPFMPPAAVSSPPVGAVKPVRSPQLRRPRMPASGAGNKTSAADQANAPVSLHLRRG